MGGFLSAALAGGAEGLGLGAVEGAKMQETQDRDARLNAMEQNRQAFLEQLRQQGAKDLQGSQQTFTAGENEKSRAQAKDLQESGFAHAEALQNSGHAFQSQLEQMREKHSTELTRLSAALQDASKNNDVINVTADDQGNMFGVKRDGGTVDLKLKGSKPMTEQMKLLASTMAAENKSDHDTVKDLRDSLLTEKDAAKKAAIKQQIGEAALRIEDRNNALLDTLSPGMKEKLDTARSQSNEKQYSQKIASVSNEALTAIDMARNDPAGFKKNYPGADPAKVLSDFKSKYNIDPVWADNWFATNKKARPDGVPR